MNHIVILMAILLAVSGCNKSPETSANENPVSVKNAPAKKTIYTADNWRTDFSSAFEARNSKTDNNGITEFQACFNPKDDKCEIGMVGMKDGFRKVHHITPPLTYLHSELVKYIYNGTGSYIGMRIVAIECKAPIIVLNPVMFGKEWLFMDQVAFMGDGDVLFEKRAEINDVQRTVEDGINESWAFAINASDYPGLKKFSSATSKAIRLTGKNSYMTVKDDAVTKFTDEFPEILQAIEIINTSLKKNGGPNCVVEDNSSKT